MIGMAHRRSELTIELPVQRRERHREPTDRNRSLWTEEHWSVFMAGVYMDLAVAPETDGGHGNSFDHGPMATNHRSPVGDGGASAGDHGNIGCCAANVDNQTIDQSSQVERTNHACSWPRQDGLDRPGARKRRRN